MTSNIAASVRQRLLNRTRETGENYQTILTRFALERLLFRLTQLPGEDEFVLKGAFTFLVWEGEEHRSTRDLDLLGSGSPEPGRLQQRFAEVCQVNVQEDGVQYDARSIQVDPIREKAAYDGLRVKLTARIGSARLPLQVDVGFGDAVVPPPEREFFPRLLDDFPAPVVKTYPPEVVIAEKLHGIVQFGKANSRMKDYYDLWHLSQCQAFAGKELEEAIQATFKRRGREVPGENVAGLSEGFASDAAKQRQWKAFTRRTQLTGAELSFSTVVEATREFLKPLLKARSDRKSSLSAGRHWSPGGPWRSE